MKYYEVTKKELETCIIVFLSNTLTLRNKPAHESSVNKNYYSKTRWFRSKKEAINFIDTMGGELCDEMKEKHIRIIHKYPHNFLPDGYYKWYVS